MAVAEYDSRAQPKRHWLIYTSGGHHYLVHATEDEVWTRQMAYIKERRAQGLMLSQISFVYLPVSVTLLTGVK